MGSITRILIYIALVGIALSACGNHARRTIIGSAAVPAVINGAEVDGRDDCPTGKLISSPPIGPANRVRDLTATRETNGDFTLSWHYRNLGDYDQNGVVGVSDITPLAMHYNETYDADTEPDCIQAVIDGSGNGKIGIEDITPIAQNFGVSVHHYAVEGVNDYTQPYVEAAQVAIPAHSNIGRVALTYNLGASPQKYYRVVPIDADGTRGESSNVVSTQAGDAPQILSVSPTEGVSGTEATFSSEVTVDGPFEYSWDFGGGAAPGTSADVSPTVTLSSGGTLAQPIRTYQASLAISSPFGSVSYPFNLDVSARWHIEEIPKVPGHEGDEIEQALYDYAPDGALWGIHRYPGKYKYLFRWQGDAFEYEQLPWDHVYDYLDSFKVDKQGRPVVLGREYTGVLQWKPFFAVRTVEGWEQEEIDQTGQLMFDSANQAVIVYGAIWVARRTATGVWEKEQIQGAVGAAYTTAAIGTDDAVRICYTSDYDLFFALAGSDGIEITMLQDGWFNEGDGSYCLFSPSGLAVQDSLARLQVVQTNYTPEPSLVEAKIIHALEGDNGWEYEEVLSGNASYPEYIPFIGAGVISTSEASGSLVLHKPNYSLSLFIVNGDGFAVLQGPDLGIRIPPLVLYPPTGKVALASSCDVAAYW